MMAQMTMHEIDAAALRCTRLAVGVREAELERLLGVEAGVVAAWEQRRAPIVEGAVELLGKSDYGLNDLAQLGLDRDRAMRRPSS